jgi:hypothetical protein
MPTNLTRAAGAALRTHDELSAAEAIGDTFELGADDLPADGHGWLAWHAEQYKPAFAAWKTAMGQLQAALGNEFPGTHPLNFRPVCEHILSGVADTDMSAGGVR